LALFASVGGTEGDHGGGVQVGSDRVSSVATRNEEGYMREHEEKYAAEVRASQEKQLHRRARELGDVVLKVEPEADPAPPTTAIPQVGE